MCKLLCEDKCLEKGEVEENKKQGAAEGNHYALAPVSCTAQYLTKEIGTD